MKASRIVLVVLGVLLLGLGVFVLADTVKPVKILGVASWFVLALILHDGIIAFITFGVSLVMRRAGRRMPIAVLAIIQGGLVVISIFAVIVLPEIYKQSIGSKNPTVLPLDYGPSLIAVWAGIVVATVLGIVVYYAVARRLRQHALTPA